jgi:hypothetical protein
MEIKPTYVTFEQAKLLADKKFLVHTRYGYTKDGVLERPHYGETYINSDFENSLTYSAPEQHQVIEWLRVNHGIFIAVDVIYNLFKYKILQCNGIVSQTFGNEFKCSSFDYNSPQEAYSKAFDYILKELI